MDKEQEKFPIDSDDRSSSIFGEFMMRIAKFEELVDLGGRCLAGFHQELETFRRPQLYKTSNVVDNIIEANQTGRMTAYVEAGCRHRHHDVQNMINLHSYRQGLEDHLTKVKILLSELESLKEDAIDIAKMVNHNASQSFYQYYGDDRKHEEQSLDKDETVQTLFFQDKSLSYATLMTAIHNMLKLDYKMQEHIISSVSLIDASSEQVESYCFMWDLHPYMDDNIVRQGWKIVRL